MQRDEVLELVQESLSDILAEYGSEQTAPASESTSLIGRGSVLDSLGLVQLIVAIEQRLHEAHGLSIMVADDRAMSLKNSPFRTVATLTDYVLMLVEEQRSNV